MDLKPFLLFFTAIGLASATAIKPLEALSKNELDSKLHRAFYNYFLLEDDAELQAIASQLQMPNLFKLNRIGDISNMGLSSYLTCNTCRTAVNVLIIARSLGLRRDTLFSLLASLCTLLNLSTEEVCQGILDNQLDSILYIIDNGDNISGTWACSVLLQSLECDEAEGKDWTIEVDDGYSADKIETRSSENIKIVQISDLHYDELYTPGSDAECDLPICCGSDGGEPDSEDNAAGYWGDYRACDTPWHSIVDTFEHITNNHDVTYVYFTGDIISHRIWRTTQSENTEHLEKSYDLIDSYFGNSRIFPVLGNHEPHLVNQYPPEDLGTDQFSNDWLFELAAEKWSRWLPSSALETVRKGGYYTVKVNDKFRVIVLNSNVCYVMNFWVLYENGDFYGQLEWLRDVLAEAEANGESVHILGHIPTGSEDCYKVWAREYRKIINRYANNVKAAFNGHTHYNEFQLFYNTSDPDDPILVAFNGGSVTCYNKLNLNYIVYEADSETMDINDAAQYTFNLTLANQAGSEVSPDWFRLYSFKSSFGLEDATPASIHKLVNKMATDRSLAQAYYRYKHKDSDTYMSAFCDEDCLLGHVCESVTSLINDNTHCDLVTRVWNAKK